MFSALRRQGGSAGKVPLSSVLDLASELPQEGTGPVDVQSASDEDLRGRLDAMGVDATGDHPRESLETALAVAGSVDFWRRHHDLHPNKSRVKNWLWVHDRFRTQVHDLVEMAEALSKDAGAAKSKFSAKLAKFMGKIESHSQFEDTQLFKYFDDNGPGCKAEMADLQMQHMDLQAAQGISTALQKDGADLGEVVELVKAYEAELLGHLEAEERTLVHRWLNLDAQQYKKYRTYLSWKYGAMY